ncbi:hypothetical protein COMNV_00826 [Commensalibacter sp. Nvir]|uniref:YjzC family protein n=1 Tax=Commensalibacter sp. Nvir TaxID=3069817 RepID=UPI002D689B7B|nr:hypothetical protein COMNV_00826 [Commensalibacter sp. Nvir]
MHHHKPGDKVLESGIYGQYSSDGKKINEVTCVKGERFPPTPKHDMYYKIIRKTQ